MSSVDVQLITSVLSATAGNISRTSSAPSVLLTTIPDTPQSKQQDGDGPFEDIGLAASLDGVDAEGVDAWSKLDGMCIDGLQDGVLPTLAMFNGSDDCVLTLHSSRPVGPGWKAIPQVDENHTSTSRPAPCHGARSRNTVSGAGSRYPTWKDIAQQEVLFRLVHGVRYGYEKRQCLSGRYQLLRKV